MTTPKMVGFRFFGSTPWTDTIISAHLNAGTADYDLLKKETAELLVAEEFQITPDKSPHLSAFCTSILGAVAEHYIEEVWGHRGKVKNVDTHAWIDSSGKDQWRIRGAHTALHLTVVYYLEAEDRVDVAGDPEEVPGDLVLIDPRGISAMRLPELLHKKLTGPKVIRPVKDMCVVFPSHIRHYSREGKAAQLAIMVDFTFELE